MNYVAHAAVFISYMILGFTTTSNILHCLVAIFVNNPDIQTRIQEEIKEVMGERLPTLSDRANMPYTEAVSIHLAQQRKKMRKRVRLKKDWIVATRWS